MCTSESNIFIDSLKQELKQRNKELVQLISRITGESDTYVYWKNGNYWPRITVKSLQVCINCVIANA